MKISQNNTLLLDIEVDDNSYRYRAIKGDNSLTLYFATDTHVEIPIGATCEFENETYTLFKPENLKMEHSRKFEYTVIFEAEQAKAGKWKFKEVVIADTGAVGGTQRLKFGLTAKPREHLQMFVDNMNLRDGGGWTVGRCVDAPEKYIAYNHAYCIDALTQMADAFETEYEFVGKQVSLWKVEYNRDNPLPLSYGRGNGFKPGVGRSNYDNSEPIETLYTQGGTRNIDPSQYGNAELLLPKSQSIRFDGQHFEDEDGFEVVKARTYITDAEGLSIRRGDKALSTQAEDSLDCSEIYPSRVGTVSSVVEVDTAKNFYDIVDDTIPNNLNFEDYLIAGETMTVIFQSGMLASREFEVKYHHEATSGKAARRFEIVPQEMDGQMMPGGVFVPAVGDKYAVFHCALPQAYISDDVTKSGASWEMFRQGVRYLYDNEEQKFSFTGELDGIWAKKDWANIGGRIKLGGFVLFSDARFQREGVAVRIVGIKEYINRPHSPEIELSNSPVGRSVSSALKQIESNEVVTDDLHKEAIAFTKRRYRDASETIRLLDEAMLENFTAGISPATVQAMMVFLGSQFRFVESTANPEPTTWDVSLDQTTQEITAPAGVIQRVVAEGNSAGTARLWTLAAKTFARMTDPDAAYYLYAKVSTSAAADDPTPNDFVVSTTPIAVNGVAGYEHLLVGILNSEHNGLRSYAPLVGYTEILPGMVRTDRIVSSQGNSWFDLLKGTFLLGDQGYTQGMDFGATVAGQMTLKNANIMVGTETTSNIRIRPFLADIIGRGYINGTKVGGYVLSALNSGSLNFFDQDGVARFRFEGDGGIRSNATLIDDVVARFAYFDTGGETGSIIARVDISPKGIGIYYRNGSSMSITVSGGTLNVVMRGLPTSAVGRPVGTVWVDENGFLKVVR